jgi:peroxiredoxin
MSSLDPGRSAPDAILQDADGRDVRLSDLWRAGPSVLVFLRHFG